MPVPNDFLQRHVDTEHPYLPIVRAAVVRGEARVDVMRGHPLDESFHTTYTVRTENLARQPGPNAARLNAELEALLEVARSEADVLTDRWHYTLDDGRTYHFIERSADGTLLGAFASISRTAASMETWLRYWGKGSDDLPG